MSYREANISSKAAPAEDAVNVLTRSELVAGCTRGQIAQLALLSHQRNYSYGELICDEHERSDELYVIAEGTVEAWLNPAATGDHYSALRRVGMMQAGQVCGEVAMLDEGVRSAQLRAGSQGATLLVIPKRELLVLCEADTSVGYRVMFNLATILARRLRQRR